MGHERVGLLPKSKKWIDLVEQIGLAYSSDFPVAVVAADTLENVRKQYGSMCRDEAVQSVFGFLVQFSKAVGDESPFAALQAAGINLTEKSTILSVVRALKDQVPQEQAGTEYGQITISAAADALGQWHREHASKQMDMFKPSESFLGSMQELGSGSGFCELSRLFFGKVTERYLNYFLERAASSNCPTIEARDRFNASVREHVDSVSKHAFESSKITQSFAAGWFNKHARDSQPNMGEVESFLSVAFGKMREELRREGESR
jgi:hypothetical protein